MAERRKPSVQYLNIFLIKSDERFQSDQDVIVSDQAILYRALRDGLSFTGRLYFRSLPPHPPKWIGFLNPFLVNRLPDLPVASASAVLLLNTAGRRFAVVFGYGRALLQPDCWVRDFGLRATVNAVDPDHIRTIDSRTFEEFTLEKRQQASRMSNVDMFGLDAMHDLIRQVTGKPSDPDFAIRVGGADAVAIAKPLRFPEIGELCNQLLTAYSGTSYRDRFGFIDNLRIVKDPIRIAELDERLIRSLENHEGSTIHMAPPEAADWDSVAGFRYSFVVGAKVFPDLEIPDLLGSIREYGTLSPGHLQGIRIGVRHPDGNYEDNKWTAYDCLVCEIDAGDLHYALAGGTWYQIDRAYVDKIRGNIKYIRNSSIPFPATTSNQPEREYNEALSKSSGYALIDRQCARAGGSPIEPCDLFTPSGQFIHVKRKSRSSTLSHLFAQGTVSAECFLYEADYRSQFRSILLNTHPEMAALVPDSKPDASTYEVIFAIAAKRMDNWPLSLPFFSQVMLSRSAEHLQRLNFNVALAQISVT